MALIPKIQYRQKLAIIILLFTFVPFIAVASIYFVSTVNAKNREILDNSRNLLANSYNNITNIYATAVQKLVTINGNPEINEYLAGGNGNDLSAAYSFHQSVKSLLKALESDSFKNRITLFAVNDVGFYGDFVREFSQLDEELKSTVMASEDNDFIWRFHTYDDDPLNGRQYICLYKKILKAGTTNVMLGVTEVRIPLKKVAEQFQYSIPKGSLISYYFSHDRKAFILKSDLPEASKIAQDYYNAGEHDGFQVIDSTPSNYNSDRVSVFIPQDHVWKQITGLIYVTLAAFAALVTLIVLTVSVASKHLTRRLTTLIASINIDIDHLEEREETVLFEREDEFSQINRKFLELVGRIKDYYSKITEYEVEKKVLEQELLQSLINPHFLYNTLSAIKWKHEDKSLAQLIDSMVKYYRIALNKGNKILKILMEIKLIEEYLKIQKYAYDSDLCYTIDVDESIGEYFTINHLLQPVVENAFLHGINALESGGRIIITGKQEGDHLVFEVKDNGAGMSREKMDQIINGDGLNIYSGYGLKNVQKRIETYFGKGYGISFQSEEGKGTVATLVIPVVTDKGMLQH